MKTLESSYGKIELQQDAYISDCGTYYKAYATLGDREFNVRWEIALDVPAQCDDESNMCDWARYTVTEI